MAFFNNAFGDLEYVQAKGGSQTLFNGRARRFFINLHFPTEEVTGVEPFQHQVGIGNGRLLSPLAVAHGPRFGPGALRPYLEDATAVDPGNAAATRPNRVDVDHGDV